MNRQGTAVRRRGDDHDIRHFAEAGGVVVVDFNDDLIGVLQVGRGSPDGGDHRGILAVSEKLKPDSLKIETGPENYSKEESFN